ncbi:MAG: phage tail sheath C-terminal domain-containing protein [Bacteroidota bacterium]
MPSTYKTPGVYVEEITKFPPSVAQVATAIPAFIGHTEFAKEKVDGDLRDKPFEVKSLLEYETFFGKAQKEANLVATIEESSKDATKTVVNIDFSGPRSPYVMYYSMQAFFANGGGKCYVVSVGAYGDIANPVSDSNLARGLKAIEKEDEITLIVFPENQGLASYSEHGTLLKSALDQCRDLQDRFVVMDVREEEENELLKVSNDASKFRDEAQIGADKDDLKYGAVYYPSLQMTFNYDVDESVVAIVHNLDGNAGGGGLNGKTLADVKQESSAFYNRSIAAIEGFPCLLPASPAMVGIYASVDSNRGVWKAPANVGITGIVKPNVKISAKEQEDLNVDVNAGKSINAIRTFLGKGTLVWGARTLAGNDNEWRYIPVRRFFNMAEESIKKATEQFVFEPNDANTWVRVRAMIENFLTLQWRAGALAGATPEEAFYVSVGLNATMTPLDILEGRMIVEIGMAVVRPAEFIILKFSHKMQES